MCSSLFDKDENTSARKTKSSKRSCSCIPAVLAGRGQNQVGPRLETKKPINKVFVPVCGKTQRPEVCDTEIGAPLTLRRYSRAPLPAPAPDTGPSLRGSCTPFAGVPHLPRALMRAVARGRAGVCLSSALRARVHASPPGKPPRPVRPDPARLRAPRKMSARLPRRAQRSPVRRYRRERWAGRAESAGRRSRTY